MKMMAFVRSNYKTCETGFGTAKEKVYVKFTIDENGFARNPEIIRAIYDCNKKNATALVGKLPPMTPGMYRGKAVRTTFVLPISIK